MADQAQENHRGNSLKAAFERPHPHWKTTTNRAIDDYPNKTSSIMASAPCGACKFREASVFAPHFSSDKGAARFAAVHKVFGASNVSKLLLDIPLNRKHDVVVMVSYEAQARLSNPVYGCVSTIFALQ